MSTRQQNERKFEHWEDLPREERRYWIDVASRSGWKVRYVKEVDANDITLRFYQEVYNEIGEMIEVHHKYPVDLGHRKV
ncbi:MAG: hypothetical protein HP491_19085 [Nitrospira sp.]|nr:hypothetical protein [Nitrospira sp.]MBH0186886.1 hypothetical protein [Nitrospira sp.]